MAKNKPKRQRKYVPHKRAHRMHEQIRATAWYAGGSWQESVGTIAGNFDYPNEFCPVVAKQIIEQKNQWACLLVAFMDIGTEVYTKCRQTDSIWQHTTREAAERIIEPQLHAWRDAQNANQIISISWFMVPNPSIDLLELKSEIASILEQHGAADRLLCELAGDLRMNDIERIEKENQEAA
jgi:hypothetical protein